MIHYSKDSASTEYLNDICGLDNYDPDAIYSIGSFDPCFVGGLPFDPVRRYPPHDELEGNAK